MELRQLRYFVTVAQERHFGRAAHALHLATPSLSQQIRALERELQVVLLERGPRGVELTPAGEVLLEHARVLLGRAEHAREAVHSAVPGTCRVALRLAPGVPGAIGSTLRGLGVLAPEVEVDAAVSHDRDAVAAVQQDRADAAVVWGGEDSHGLAVRTLCRIPVRIVVPPGHRLALANPVPVARVAEEETVLYPSYLASALRQRWTGDLSPHGHRVRVRRMSDPAAEGPAALFRAVRAGRGVALVTTSQETDFAGALVVVRPLIPPLDIALHLVWREPPEAALHRLIAHLVTACAGRVIAQSSTRDSTQSSNGYAR
ncbi:LysR family transcriptional regulator [Pseudonocardia bannensis]|uniref:LysR family transcriptional regulator n=1 Tax=Pseudonocardia bannensis TaxID=630973 RepID=A0A848DIB1_9PSEU|nr:LysR family transcriptional regulator [Pseudonocardia bannensis]NMH92295.1 LysR family transcriptional regulator [Pseudonocardia bannensis]